MEVHGELITENEKEEDNGPWVEGEQDFPWPKGLLREVLERKESELKLAVRNPGGQQLKGQTRPHMLVF